MACRVRTQKKIFTPTTAQPEPQCFLCKVIETGEIVIVQKSSIKRLYDDTAEVLINGRRVEATVEHRGTREDCRYVWGMREDVNEVNHVIEEVNSEMDDVENDVVYNDQIDVLRSSSSVAKSIKSFTPQLKRKSIGSNVFPNSRPRSLSMKPPKKSKPDHTPIQTQLLDDDHSTDTEREDEAISPLCSAIKKHMDFQFESIRQENAKEFKDLSRKLNRKHNFDFIDLSSFRESNSDDTFGDVMYGEINLNKIRSKSVSDYARQVLRIIFTQSELISCILPPGGSQYVRQPLDSDKFEKLHDALRSKYRISSTRYDDFYSKLVRSKLVDFLSDERKRERKRNSIQNS